MIDRVNDNNRKEDDGKKEPLFTCVEPASRSFYTPYFWIWCGSGWCDGLHWVWVGFASLNCIVGIIWFICLDEGFGNCLKITFWGLAQYVVANVFCFITTIGWFGPANSYTGTIIVFFICGFDICWSWRWFFSGNLVNSTKLFGRELG